MKIIHVSHLYHPSTGGVQLYFKNVSERLVKDYGDEVTVITTNSYYGPERKLFKKIEPSEETINGVKVIRFSYRRWHIGIYNFVRKILSKISLPIPEWFILQANGPYSIKMNNYLKKVQADAICASSSNYYFMQLPIWRRCNFFYFGSIHLSEDRSKKVLSKIQKQSIESSTAYIANTYYEKQRLVESGIDDSKIEVLGVGVSEKEFYATPSQIRDFRKDMQLKDGDVQIAYIGRIERTKNVLALINAFEKVALHNQNVHLLIAGSGNDYIKHLQEHCSVLDANVATRIQWKINFLPSEKPVIFNSIDILVLPSNNESFGIVFLEAWACKKPVIGVNIGAVKDVITDGEDGLLMKKDDTESLAKHIETLCRNEEMRKKLGEKGYEKVIHNYTWDKITARLRGLYSQGMIQVKS